MKKLIILSAIVLFTAISLTAQKAEVLYFKAALPCCQATACDALEADVKSIIEKNFKKTEVLFREIKLADEASKKLVEQYSAKSQTLIIVNKANEGVSINISDVLRAFLRSGDKAAFEKSLVERIKLQLK